MAPPHRNEHTTSYAREGATWEPTRSRAANDVGGAGIARDVFNRKQNGRSVSKRVSLRHTRRRSPGRMRKRLVNDAVAIRGRIMGRTAAALAGRGSHMAAQGGTRRRRE